MTRRSLTRAQRVRIWDDHEGVCHICELPIKLGEKWECDHVIPRGLTGSDELSEFAPAHVACHSKKTKGDNRTVKKAVRTRAKHLGIRKPGGFPKTFKGRPIKFKVGGGVVYADNGEPVR